MNNETFLINFHITIDSNDEIIFCDYDFNNNLLKDKQLIEDISQEVLQCTSLRLFDYLLDNNIIKRGCI